MKLTYRFRLRDKHDSELSRQVRTHENPAARVVLLQALNSFAVPSTSTTDTQQQADSAAPPDPSPT